MKKRMIIVILAVFILLFPALAMAQDGTVNVLIEIESDNTNVGISSGDSSVYGIQSGDNSKYYINGQDLDTLYKSISTAVFNNLNTHMFSNLEQTMFDKANSVPQFGPPPQGGFIEGDIALPVPPPPPAATPTVIAVPSNNYDASIGELYEAVNLANQEREILADALVKAITIIEQLQGEVGELHASSLIVEPEPPATSPDELTVEEMLAMQGNEIASLKLRLLINEIITLLLLIAAIIAAIRYRNSIFGSSAGKVGKASKASVA